MDQEYEFHVVMKTTCGNYESNTVKALTHTLNNLTGICVTFGTFHDGINLPEIKELVEKMGASYTEEIGIETTHLIAQVPGGSNYDYAVEHSIPVVKPDWVVQCDRNKKIQVNIVIILLFTYRLFIHIYYLACSSLLC
jgi:NAD-dependent DNA ligase